MKMKLRKLITTAGLVGFLSVGGCENKSQSSVTKKPTTRDYFATVPLDIHNNATPFATMTSGDFDSDGDLDFILGVRSDYNFCKLYLFKNDGKGNFEVDRNYNTDGN